MRVCLCSTLFWLAHLFFLSITNGADNEEGYKPRRWTTTGDGPYRMVVSSEPETLAQEESVSLVVAQEKKKRDKPSEEDLTEKYDKVTQRIILKRARKRDQLLPEVIGPRKRRRNPSPALVASTTGLPQTMSYNLYNHFRPLDQDVPQDHILPFLDFGRKLSTGSTPSGVNSIESSSTPRGVNALESSSTPRGEHPTTRIEDEDVFHEDMDVTVMKKAVERNTVPRGPIPMKPHFVAFFRKNTTELLPVNKTIALETKSTPNVVQNKTDIKDVHYDLQSNESGLKYHAVLSPNYGLRLNRTEKTMKNDSYENFESRLNRTEKITHDIPENFDTTLNKTENPILNSTNETSNIQSHEEETQNSTSTTTPKILETTDKVEVPKMAELRLEEPKINDSHAIVNEKINNTQPREIPVPVSSPKPTARILSTAVVTSVSVKETLPRLPRIKTNFTRPDVFQRLPLKNVTEVVNSTPHHFSDSRIRTDNFTIIGLQNIRRKMYTTLRPKTTTYRPVTFRSAFRRNFTGFGAGVVHVLSTPPTYIEVPKILTNAPIKLNNNQHSISPTITTSTEPPSTYFNTSMEPSLSVSPLMSNHTNQSNKIVISSTTSESTTELTTTTSTTTAATFSSTTIGTTLLHTSPSPPNIFTTSIRPLATELINHPSAVDSQPTDNIHQLTDTEFPEETTHIPENSTVEIEFKPLDFNTLSTTEVSSKNITRRPSLLWIYNQRNNSVLRTQPVGVAYSEPHISLVTYVLAGLALIPLILGLSVLARQIFKKSKKKVLDESEYSSEYNRTPLPTKLPRVPAHINWEGEKPPSQPVQATPIPVTKWEFSRDKLRLQTVLGQGNFGQVWKAEADDLSGHEGSTRLVAVKTVKEGASLREKEDLLRELGIMQELGAHPNVVTLLGCCTEKEPYLLIMEYVMYGKLLAFLREHRTRAHYFNFSDLSSALTSRDLTFFAYCVARGMEYLVTKGIIHRDLAARNILVDHTKLCKIADFGMSRNVRDTGQIYEQRPNRGALPIRWMAPESLHLSLFTHKSDVWSFGILLWEIITLGSTPYNKMGAREVMRQVREGYRLEKPKHCRSEFYKIVTKCWHSDPAKRPSFTDLKQDIASLLGDDQTNGEYVDLEALTEEMCDQNT